MAASRRFDVLIVGGGHGGAQAAIALRLNKFEGSIAIVGEETELPYDRPPLSKEYLSGDKPWEKLIFRSQDSWAEREVELLPGRKVVGVNPETHEVVTDGGERFGYGRLIWSTGGSPRQLSCSGRDLSGVHSVRNRADVDRMKREMPDVCEVVVIGGGYIGLEAAAVLTKLGKRVTVLEALDRVLARVAGEPLSRFYEAEHRSHGVDVRLEVGVDCIEAQGDRAAGVRLADGSVLSAQMVIVGIGIEPAVQPLLAAGAEGPNGIRVDEVCRTSLPDVYAIGDCAEHRSRFAGGEWVRLESVQNANDQAAVVAKSICGTAAPYEAVPWFWSNQYDLKLQTVGLLRGYDELVVRGDIAQRSFSVIYLRERRVIALDCVNSVRDYSQGRLLVASGIITDPAELMNPSIPLKSLLTQAAA